MFTGPDIKLGEKIAFVVNGEAVTQTVTGVEHQSGGIVYEEQTRWEKFVRALTPKRWRKPRPYHYELPSVKIHCDDPIWRMDRSIQSINKTMATLLDESTQ